MNNYFKTLFQFGFMSVSILFSSCSKDPMMSCPEAVPLNGWKMQIYCPPFEKTLGNIFFVDERTGFVTGEYGAILRTDDGGFTWNDLTFNDQYRANSIFFINVDTGFVSLQSYYDRSCKFEYTESSGQNWVERSSPQSGYFKGMYFFDSKNGVSFVLDKPELESTIYWTNDGGLSWNNTGIKALSTDYNKFIFPLKNIGFVIDKNHQLLKTIDSGHTWNEIPTPIDSSIYSISFRDVNEGYIKSVSTVYKTIDGGISWQDVSTSFGSFTSYFLLDNQNMLGTINQTPYFETSGPTYTTFYSSDNSGASWLEIGTLNNYFVYDLSFSSPNVAYGMIGNNSIIKLERE